VGGPSLFYIREARGGSWPPTIINRGRLDAGQCDIKPTATLKLRET